MLFITAGMGGGTGTGAAPVIASIAKDLGILTVGIVTIPFTFEGKKRKIQADDGISELKKHVDTLLIICNDKLRELCGDLKLSEAFSKADDVLTTAAKGIAEIITVTGYINVDFEDVKTVMNNGGKAIMGYAQAEGEKRAIQAVKGALTSPLLNDNEIEGASNVLLYITSGQEEISMDEVTEITDYIQQEAKSQAEIIWGNGYDESLGNNISITLIATGFEAYKKNAGQEIKKRYKLHEEIKSEQSKVIQESSAIEHERVKHPLEMTRESSQDSELHKENREFTHSKENDNITPLWKPDETELTPEMPEAPEKEFNEPHDDKETQRTFVFEFEQDKEEPLPDKEKESNSSSSDPPEFNVPEANKSEEKENIPEEVKPFEVYIKKSSGDFDQEDDSDPDSSSIDLKSQERIERLRNLSLKLKSESAIQELENEPAYIRRKVELNESTPSSEGQISRYSLYEDPDSKNPELRSGNSYLHDNVD
jgi:cell division protein FtsZ